MRKKEQQMNGGPHHFLLHNMNANSPNGINGSIRNGRFGGSQGGQTNGTNHMSLTVNPYTGTTQAHAGDQNTHQDASERNYSPEDLVCFKMKVTISPHESHGIYSGFRSVMLQLL